MYLHGENDESWLPQMVRSKTEVPITFEELGIEENCG